MLAFVPPFPLMVIPKYSGNAGGGHPELSNILGFYSSLG